MIGDTQVVTVIIVMMWYFPWISDTYKHNPYTETAQVCYMCSLCSNKFPEFLWKKPVSSFSYRVICKTFFCGRSDTGTTKKE